MNDIKQPGFLIPLLAAVPFFFVACSDSTETGEGSGDANTDDTSGSDGTTDNDGSVDEDVTEDVVEPDTGDAAAPDTDVVSPPDAGEDTVEADGSADDDVIEDTIETDGSAEGDIIEDTDTVETDGSAEGDVIEDTDTVETDTVADTDTVGTDATTDTDEPDSDTGVDLDVDSGDDTVDGGGEEPDAFDRFFEALNLEDLASYCEEVVECGYESTVEECELSVRDFIDDNLEYAYEVAPFGLREGCVEAAIDYANCAFESGYCYEYDYETYFYGGYYFCGDESDLVDELCLTPYAGTCDGDTLTLEIDQLCDGASDCVDGFDEAACSLCEDGTTLFRDDLGCNGELDCADLTEDATDIGDEVGCEPSTIFECDNGVGIEIDDVCDGEDSCGDGSDEAGCPTFTCADGETEILLNFTCNADLDCAEATEDPTDLTDEIACDPVTIFVCGDGETVIPAGFVCDTDADCARTSGDPTDLSDEITCDPVTIFVCGDGTSARLSDVCDGFEDCDDGSDEADCP